MATLGLIEYKNATPEVKAVYDDIMATRKTDWINNFWKAIAHDPAMLKRTWEDIKQVMAPGALDLSPFDGSRQPLFRNATEDPAIAKLHAGDPPVQRRPVQVSGQRSKTGC